MKTSDFDYALPTGLIAQQPVEPRDRSRLMVVHRSSGSIEHRQFGDVPEYLKAGDVLVFNDSRVIPARLSGRKAGSGGRVEILLLRQQGDGSWEALVRPGKRVKAGTMLEICRAGGDRSGIMAEVSGMSGNGLKTLTFSDETRLAELGEIPLPPYIHTSLANPERYQTVYADKAGSVAAPTAGLHFTPELMNRIKARGVRYLFLTLHIGLDTFRPVREENPQDHPIYREYGIIPPEVAAELSRAREEGRRIVCVGTTTVRLVEQATQSGQIQPFAGWVSLFILPGHEFRMTDALITNFHLPRSTLLMLVSAFAGRELIKQAYETAVTEKYRFYSFGDAMLVI